jgi:hypothetical protein
MMMSTHKKILIGAVCVFALCLMLSVWIELTHAGTLPAQLDWTNPDIVDKIQIEKSASLTGTYTILSQPAAETSAFLDATNAPGDAPCYRLAYVNPSGIGPYAGPVCKTFPAIPTQTPGAFTVR